MPQLCKLDCHRSSSTVGIRNSAQKQDKGEDDAVSSSVNDLQESCDKIENEDEQEREQEQQQQVQMPAVANFASNLADFTASEPYVEQAVQSRSCQPLRPRTHNRLVSVRQQQQQPQQQTVTASESAAGEVSIAVEDTNAEMRLQQSTARNFVEMINRKAAGIRTLVARTAQLWSAVDQEEHANDTLHEFTQQPLQDFATTALNRSIPMHNVFDEDGSLTMGSDDEEYGEREEDTEIESIDVAARSMAQFDSYCTGNIHPSRSFVEQGAVGDWRHGMSSDGGHEGERFDNDSEDTASESEGLQLEHDIDASNRAINALKARAIKNAMLTNLVRLSFREDLTRAALEAGVLEIYNYDPDCELAYVDIFMSLVKMVCDAHVDVVSGKDAESSWATHDENFSNHVRSSITHATSPSSVEQHSFLPFKWPVFDMAQFEYEMARLGTCFDSVCVLTNLPQVSMDRMEELKEILSCNIFCMIGDPIQVVIPSGSSTGCTKGCAFLEFDDPDMAQRCALAVDGLTWGRGSFARIRGNMYRQYQVSTSDEWAPVMSDDGASSPCSLVSVRGSGSFSHAAPMLSPAFEHSHNQEAERFELNSDVALQQSLLSDEEDSDKDEWVGRRCPLDYTQFNSSPLLDLSSGIAGTRGQCEPSQLDIASELEWDDEVLDGENLMQQGSEGESDGENDERFDSHSVLEFHGPDEEKLLDHSMYKNLVREYTPSRLSLSSSELHATPSMVIASASAIARDSHSKSCMTTPSWNDHESNKVVTIPWQRYCEDLILRNCEMQEQFALARRRITQLSHNNRKLNLLIDRVERDRDGLLFENNVLESQLYGYKDHEQHYDSLIKELVLLRKGATQQEHSFAMQTPDPRQQTKAICAISDAASGVSYDFRAVLSHIASMSFAKYKIEELKEWEQQLESTLSHVRSMKEERALEMQKKLDRQVEEQNELKLCVICLSNEKSILCLPCRHLCLCQTCSHRQEVIKCPICRLAINELLAVYS